VKSRFLKLISCGLFIFIGFCPSYLTVSIHFTVFLKKLTIKIKNNNPGIRRGQKLKHLNLMHVDHINNHPRNGDPK